MTVTKSNGVALKPSSKKHKLLVTKPNLRMGAFKKDHAGKPRYANFAIYKDTTGKFVRQQIKSILTHPINSYKKQKYLIPGVQVQTIHGVPLSICSVKAGIIRGVLVTPKA